MSLNKQISLKLSRLCSHKTLLTFMQIHWHEYVFIILKLSISRKFRPLKILQFKKVKTVKTINETKLCLRISNGLKTPIGIYCYKAIKKRFVNGFEKILCNIHKKA